MQSIKAIIFDILGVNANEAVVDDRIGNVEGAQQSGLKGILYTEFAQMRTELNHYLA